MPWVRVFLDELLRTEGDIDAAAVIANVTLPEAFAHRDRSSIFADAWMQATRRVRKMRAERLEAVAYHDATYGRRKYKFTPQGESIPHPTENGPYYETERDSRLVTFMLKTLDPETFGDRAIVTGPGGGPIRHVVATLADVVRIAALAEEGKIPRTEVVGHIPDGVIDAEI